MTFSKPTAITLLDLCEASYALATTGHCNLQAGFSDAVPIRLPSTGRPFFLDHDPLDIFGYTTTKDGVSYVVFRGTEITSGAEFLQEWAEDALSLPLKPMGPGHVHLGFYDAWMALRAVTLEAGIGSTTGRVVTGHSLGAAIATLCWADIGGDLMSFAGPRVGNPKFADSLWKGGIVRVVNKPDIVPDVPIDLGGPDSPFRHGGTEVMVDGPGGGFDWHVAHNLESYREGIEKL